MTALCGDAQENIDFYAGVLGLRLIKVTVNFDDPSAYHLYYGDGAGTPGTVLTFFPYPQSPEGRPGVGQITVTSLSVRPESFAYWSNRLADYGSGNSSEEDIIDFSAPDGLMLKLVADEDYTEPVLWEGSAVPHEHAIAGMYSVTLDVADIRNTDALLVQAMGYQRVAQVEDTQLYRLPGPGLGKIIELRARPGAAAGRGGHGSVHHIAFRVADDAQQLDAREELITAGAQVSDVRDRDYFHSIYFREPGGVLFEIATDTPGFATDETLALLGTSLRLPVMHQPNRAAIEAALPKIKLPAGDLPGVDTH